MRQCLIWTRQNLDLSLWLAGPVCLALDDAMCNSFVTSSKLCRAYVDNNKNYMWISINDNSRWRIGERNMLDVSCPNGSFPLFVGMGEDNLMPRLHFLCIGNGRSLQTHPKSSTRKAFSFLIICVESFRKNGIFEIVFWKTINQSHTKCFS